MYNCVSVFVQSCLCILLSLNVCAACMCSVPVLFGDGKTNNTLSACKRLKSSLSTSFLGAAAFVGGLMNARNMLVLFGEHNRLKNDWQRIAVAYSSQQHPFTSHM